jgi:hypothetical protein
MLDIYQSFLRWVEQLLGISNVNVAFTILFMLAMAAPVVLIFTATAFSKSFTGESLANAFAKFGYAVIPLDLAGMLAHNLFHILAEGKAIYFSFMGLFGMHMEGSMAFVSDPKIQIMQYFLVIVGIFGSLYTAYRIAKNNYGASKALSVSVPYFVIILILGIVNFLAFTVRMGLRM